MRSVHLLAITAVLFGIAPSERALAEAKTGQVTYEYKTPKDPDLQDIQDMMQDRKVLEKLSLFLSPFKLPKQVKFLAAGCDGEDDAFYGDQVITICYEMIDELDFTKPKKVTNHGVKPWDAVAGPFVSTALHEFTHAMNDLLKIPVLGREENAADLVSAYIILQMGPKEARRMIGGTVYSYNLEAHEKGRSKSVQRFASDHGTPAQRMYNIACIAYGSGLEIFKDVKALIPGDRAERCAEEYEQIQDAYEALYTPHVDAEMAKKLQNRKWLAKQ